MTTRGTWEQKEQQEREGSMVVGEGEWEQEKHEYRMRDESEGNVGEKEQQDPEGSMGALVVVSVLACRDICCISVQILTKQRHVLQGLILF